jgi:hypothetical protein
MASRTNENSRKRAVALALGLTLALPAAWFTLERWRARQDQNTVAFADTVEDMQRVIDERRTGPELRVETDTPLYDTDESFRRSELTGKTAAHFYPTIKGGRQLYDPVMSARLAPNLHWRRSRFGEHPDKGWLIHTSSLGLRNDAELADPAPSLRIVVTGDSHVEGVCSNAENLSNQLALRLRAAGAEDAEVLNAGVGGYDIYNYVGVVEARAVFEPDLYIVIVYGGNDFQSTMYLQRFHHERGSPKRWPWRSRKLLKKRGDKTGILSQELFQVLYFLNNPKDEEIVVQTATAACMEMARVADAAGARILFAYLPPPFTGQPELHAQEHDECVEVLGLPSGAVEVSDRIADAWLADLRERELAAVDLRPAFRATDERLYWRSDHHINVTAHALVAEVLEPHVRALMDPGR